METLATDIQKIDFLLEAEALLREEYLHAAALEAGEVVSEELPPEKRPKYATNYIGSKQKLVDWIWRNTIRYSPLSVQIAPVLLISSEWK